MRKGLSFLATLIMLTLMLSACSVPGNGSSNTAGQVLQNALTAMQKLKTAHVEMNMTENTTMSGLSTSTPTTNGTTPPATKLAFTIKGGGDEVLPDQTSMHLTFGSVGLGSPINLNEIVKNKTLYFKSKQGQWYSLDQSKLKGSSSASSLFTGGDATQYNQLLSLAQKAKFTDHGAENLNGTSLRHITVSFGKDALENLLNTMGGGSSGLNAESLKSMLKDIDIQKAELNLWIDESTSYVHRLELKFSMNINLNTGQFVTPTPGTSSKNQSMGFGIGFDLQIDYSKFNDSSIKITAPANAIPTTDLTKLLQ